MTSFRDNLNYDPKEWRELITKEPEDRFLDIMEIKCKTHEIKKVKKIARCRVNQRTNDART